MFHEHRDVITQLKQTDNHFNAVFEKHNNLDEEIQNMEKEHADQFQIEEKKKQKLKLKDEIYNMILKHKNS